MTTYAAHVVTYIACVDGIQKEYPIMESVVLILATSPEHAHEKAKAFGQWQEAAAELEWHGKLAQVRFAGIRRIMGADDIPSHLEGIDGVEVTFSAFTAPNLDDVMKFANNEAVEVIYQPRMGMDEP